MKLLARVVLRSIVAMFLVAFSTTAAAPQPLDPAPQVWIWSDPHHSADADRLIALLEKNDLPSHRLSELDMVTFVADAATAKSLLRVVGGRLDANERLATDLDKSVAYIGADQVKQALGLQRDGPTVLVVDTGVDSAHPDFQSGVMVANVQPVRVGGLITASTQSVPVIDSAGHGTHVAGIVAGSGASLSANDPLRGDFQGVYSNGRLASYQASAATDGEEAEVEVIAALEGFAWALENQAQYDLRVVTNSWGDRGEFDPDSPIHQATLRLYLRGFVVVFSAGNSGEDGSGTLNRYCVAPWALCVAAGDLAGTRTGFSSYGSGNPETPYDHPDLTAPGLFIRAANPVSSASGNDLVGIGGGRDASESLYIDRSGTSMAAPHVAASAALIMAANPSLSPDQVMDILVASTKPMADGVNKVGTGYLDARAAYNLAVVATGNRQEFLAGDQVKYAGPLTRDPNYANDPVTVGYDGPAGSSALALERPTDGLWVRGPVALVLLSLAVLATLVGIRWRSS